MLQIGFDIFIFVLLVIATFKWCNMVIRRVSVESHVKYIHTLLYIGISMKICIIAIWYLVAGGHEINPSVSDTIYYDSWGQSIAESIRNFTLPTSDEIPMVDFSYFVGVLYVLFGNYHFVISIYNCLLTIWMAIMVLEITLKISENKAAGIFAFTATLLYPHFISASYYLLKDITGSFLVISTIWSLYCIKSPLKKMIYVAFLLFLIAVIRKPMALIVGSLVIVNIVYMPDILFKDSRIQIRGILKYFMAFVLIFIFLLVASHINLGDTSLTESGYTLEDDIVGGEFIRLTSEGTGFKELFVYFAQRPIFFAYTMGTSFIRTFYGPFFLYAATGPDLTPYDPHEAGFRAVLECLGGTFTGLLMPFFIYGFWCVFKKNRYNSIIWLFPCCWFLFLSLASAGTNRWRLSMMSIFFIISGIGISQLHYKMKGIYLLYCLFIVSLYSINASRYEGFYLVKAIIIALAVAACWVFLSKIIHKKACVIDKREYSVRNLKNINKD